MRGYFPAVEDRWKALAGTLFAGQLVLVALMVADTQPVLALLIANVPTGILYGVQRAMSGGR